MKLIVTGATGLIGSEIVRQGLQLKSVTSVVAVSRTPIDVHEGIDSSKLKNVLVKDYGDYLEHVKAEFAGAGACIWTVGVTPTKSLHMDFEEVRRVSHTCTLEGFKAMYEAGPATPFRFLYFCGTGIPDELSTKPLILGDFRLMRGEVKRDVLALPREHDGVDVCVVHPGVVTTSKTWKSAAVQSMYGVCNAVGRSDLLSNITLAETAAAALDQAVNGFEKNSLSNSDLVRIGQEALKKRE